EALPATSTRRRVSVLLQHDTPARPAAAGTAVTASGLLRKIDLSALVGPAGHGPRPDLELRRCELRPRGHELAHSRNGLRYGDPFFLTGGPAGDLDHAVGQVPAADADLVGDPGQLGIAVLHSGPLVPVVDERVEAGRKQPAIERLRSGAGFGVPRRQQDDGHLGGRYLHRPGQPRI